MVSTRVTISDKAEQQLFKIPDFIREKLYQWVERVEEFGIYEIRKIKGFHDEPLRGARAGQRSIRLNRSYRAIYTQTTDDELVLLKIVEVTKHEY